MFPFQNLMIVKIISLRAIQYFKLQIKFFPYQFMAQAWGVWAINWWGKTRICNFPVQTENKVRKVLLISLMYVWWVWEQFLFTWNGFKFLVHFKSKTSQFEIVVEWLLNCYHVLIHNNSEVKEVLNFYF